MEEKVLLNNQSQDLTPKKDKPEKLKKGALRYKRDRDREMVRGVFRFYEVPGGSMSFCYRAYIEDPVERFDFIDGEQYTIPRGVARHLNKNGWYPVYEHIPGESFNGQSVQGVAALNRGQGITTQIGRKVHRFGFQSLEFMDDDDLKEEKSVYFVGN